MTRRGNGLTAAEYTPLADLSAGLADGVLTALRDAGVAAYVAPVTAEAREAAGSGEPAEPGQRLYVDAAARGRAEQVLMERLPGPRDAAEDTGVAEVTEVADVADAVAVDESPGETPGDDALKGTVRDEDAIWEQIVAGYDAEAPDAPSWPDRENIDDSGPRITAARIIRPAEPPLSRPDHAEPEADEESGSDEGHYIPPPPPPLPHADPVTKFAWIALAGGPLYLLLTAILQWEVPGWAAFTAVAAFVGGFVTLVLRMGDERRDDGPDDGAVV